MPRVYSVDAVDVYMYRRLDVALLPAAVLIEKGVYTDSRLWLIYWPEFWELLQLKAKTTALCRLPVLILLIAFGTSCWDNRIIFFWNSEINFFFYVFSLSRYQEYMSKLILIIYSWHIVTSSFTCTWRKTNSRQPGYRNNTNSDSNLF